MESQMITRREALVLSAVASLNLAQSRAASAQTGKPEWGNWVTHVDTTNSAARISEALKAADTIASALFYSMVLRLQGREPGSLAGSTVLAGHSSIKLPAEYPLTGFGMIARGSVRKSPDTHATLPMRT